MVIISVFLLNIILRVVVYLKELAHKLHKLLCEFDYSLLSISLNYSLIHEMQFWDNVCF